MKRVDFLQPSRHIMLRRLSLYAYVVALVLVFVALNGSPSRASFDGWNVSGYIVLDQATWIAHYKKNARIRLGPERRLPNGISWRLHEDAGTKLALPRITWMPNAQSTRTANAMLDMVHGRAMMFSAAVAQELVELNESSRANGFPLVEYDRPVVQTDVELTYATPTLLSFADLGYVPGGGTGVWRIIRGLTFDLRTKQMFQVEECFGSHVGYASEVYGAKQKMADGTYRLGPLNYLFQFGKLMRVCDQETYLKFIQLLIAKAVLVAEQTAKSKDPAVEWCSEKAGPFIGEDQEIVLYLTLKGLAVHNTEYQPNASRSYCTLRRSPVNPVILPYAELEPFMIPGAWRDELLKLH